MKNKFRGTLVGAAIGDSMGMCVEEIPFDEVILHYGDKITNICEPHPASPASHLHAGETSSEFEIIKIITESLISKKGIDIKDIIRRYIEWEEKEEIHNYVDPYFLLAVDALKKGKELERGGNSIEGALPGIPIGMFHYTNPILAVEGTKAVVMLTHRNEIVIDSASVLSVAVGELLQGRFYIEDEYPYFIELLKTFVQNEESKKYLDKVKNLVDRKATVEEAIENLGNGSYALEALSLSLFIFIINSSDTEKVIIDSVNSYGNYGGDTDSIALIAGALAGAYNSEESIPSRWKVSLKKYPEIVKLAEKLYHVVKH
ncbi:ADP-ribosylglycohydrolase family protein [Persephonella sp.]